MSVHCALNAVPDGSSAPHPPPPPFDCMAKTPTSLTTGFWTRYFIRESGGSAVSTEALVSSPDSPIAPDTTTWCILISGCPVGSTVAVAFT